MFENTGIARRYSCVPIEWYLGDHGWLDRTQLYVDNAVDLLETVTRRLLEEAELLPEEIDTIVVASTTGVATPSLDALLVERMGLRRDIQRLPIFGLGCAGGRDRACRAPPISPAPGRAAKSCSWWSSFARSPSARTTFPKATSSPPLCSATARRAPFFPPMATGRHSARPGEHTWPNSLDVMGWDMAEDGLKARFAKSIPGLVASDFRPLLNEFLARNDIAFSEIDAFACHPGGAKVLDALEEALELQRGGLEDSRSMLRDYGNMSAVTVLFVVERMDVRRKTQRTLHDRAWARLFRRLSDAGWAMIWVAYAIICAGGAAEDRRTGACQSQHTKD